MAPGRLIAVLSSFLFLSIVTVSLRFFTRIHLVKWVGLDDILILFGAVAAFGEAVSSFVGMDRYLLVEIAYASADDIKQFGMAWGVISTTYQNSPWRRCIRPYSQSRSFTWRQRCLSSFLFVPSTFASASTKDSDWWYISLGSYVSHMAWRAC